VVPEIANTTVKWKSIGNLQHGTFALKTNGKNIVSDFTKL